jgi:hypothetical protein
MDVEGGGPDTTNDIEIVEEKEPKSKDEVKYKLFSTIQYHGISESELEKVDFSKCVVGLN